MFYFRSKVKLTHYPSSKSLTIAGGHWHRVTPFQRRSHLHLFLGDEQFAVIVERDPGRFISGVSENPHLDHPVEVPAGLGVHRECNLEGLHEIGAAPPR